MSKEEYLAYYRRNLGMDEEDFSRFSDVIEQRLPTAFRITDTPLAEKIRERLGRYSFLNKVRYFEDVYEFSLSEEDSKEFTSFLANQSSIGAIQRQEIVSMLPVLLLDIREDSRIIDLCAAPGSKTKQMLEIVTSKGLVIANDQNHRRLNILNSEASKKAMSSLVITGHDASLFPRIYAHSRLLKFDRVLCDVPCSSDGTVRKNPGLLKEWDLARSTGLCSIQYRILKRGCELLEEGGLLAYSTCSLNPLENEAVVQKILVAGDFELVDFRDDSRFSVFGRGSRDDRFIIREGLTAWEGEEARNLGLEKCIRMYPQDQNTGGFFVAVLRKRRDPLSSRGTLHEKRSCVPYEFLGEEQKKKVLGAFGPGFEEELMRKTATSKSIYAVSGLAAEILRSTPKLKVADVGYKLLERCSLEFTEYRFRNLWGAERHIRPNMRMALPQLKLLLTGDFVHKSTLGIEHTGLAVVEVPELHSLFCGYGGTGSFGLFINSDLRKALSDIVNNDDSNP
jgi:tRNA (cytosine34-C5)-methyltransferase